jgi:hypothetical protein
LKRKNLPSDVQGFVFAECATLATNISNVLSNNSSAAPTESKKDSDSRNKRLKPILLCAKDLSYALKAEKVNTAPTQGKGSKTKSKSSSSESTSVVLRTALESVAKKHPTLAPLADSIIAILGFSTEGKATEDSGKKRKSDSMAQKANSVESSTAKKSNLGVKEDVVLDTSSLRNWNAEDKADKEKKRIALEKKNSKLHKI